VLSDSDNTVERSSTLKFFINNINAFKGITKMKIHQIMSESEVDEAPVGMLKRLGQKIASKVPGEIGARASGQLSASKDANAMKTDLARWMGQAQIPKGSLTISQFKQFLDQKGLPTDQLVPTIKRVTGTAAVNQVLDNNAVDQVLLKVVGQGAAATDAGGTKSKFAAKPLKTPPTGTPPAQGQGAPDITNFVNSLTPQQKAKLKASL